MKSSSNTAWAKGICLARTTHPVDIWHFVSSPPDTQLHLPSLLHPAYSRVALGQLARNLSDARTRGSISSTHAVFDISAQHRIYIACWCRKMLVTKHANCSLQKPRAHLQHASTAHRLLYLVLINDVQQCLLY